MDPKKLTVLESRSFLFALIHDHVQREELKIEAVKALDLMALAAGVGVDPFDRFQDYERLAFRPDLKKLELMSKSESDITKT